MRKFFTLLLFGLSMLAWPAMAQEIDESYVFMDEEGNIIHIQDSSLLEEGQGYNKEKVLRFFQNWTPKAVRE